MPVTPPPAERSGASPPQGGATALGRALRRAWWSILWERLWPALAAIATAAGVFLVVSWLGLWVSLPPLGRAIGLFVFLALAVGAAMPLAFVRLPTRAEALRRVDRFSDIPHRPATAVADTLAREETGDALSVALWRAHVERALASARALKAGQPSPRLPGRDPYALRALVLVAVIVTFFSTGAERTPRILAAFDWRGAVEAANFRIDAWVTPPDYTGRPPVLLPGVRPGEPVRAADAPYSVPVGSALVVRASGRTGLDLSISGGLAEVVAEAADPTGAQGEVDAQRKASSEAQAASTGALERRFVIKDAGMVTLQGGGANLAWRFAAIPDRPPTIEPATEAEPQVGGSLRLSYKLEDDYGVVAAEAVFARRTTPSSGDADPGQPRPLYEAPDLALALPQPRTRSGTGRTTKDLSEHPWAGTDVSVTLSARDDAGNVGYAEPFDLRLPSRVFTKPLARALIEQRRELALDARSRDIVAVALDALAIAPERFTPEVPVYLGLRSVYWQLRNARTDDGLRGVVERLWSMAVQIEDGDLTDTEKALRAAQDALRQALENGATDEEIRKLMDQLRAALDRHLQALAEQMRRNPELARPLDPNARQLQSQDLQRMLDRMEQMARSGARDAARQMLEDLAQMLENLQMARPGDQQNSGDDMQSALDELGDMIRRQQQLRDRTFQEGQEQRQRGPGQQPGQDQLGALQKDQQALRERLRQLMEQLKKNGFQQPGEGGDNPLGDAGEAMGDAEGRLGEGNPGGAVDPQGRALEAMRRGAQGMAQQMEQQAGDGPGPGGEPGRGRQRAGRETDPLGRPLRGREYGDDSTVRVPGEIDAQRARRILEELRRRFGESFRPQLELDYIERLLEGF